MQRMDTDETAVLWLLGGVALGALAMYLMDPDRGNRRRAHLQARFRHAAEDAREAVDSTTRDWSHRMRDMASDARSTMRH